MISEKKSDSNQKYRLDIDAKFLSIKYERRFAG